MKYKFDSGVVRIAETLEKNGFEGQEEGCKDLLGIESAIGT